MACDAPRHISRAHHDRLACLLVQVESGDAHAWHYQKMPKELDEGGSIALFASESLLVTYMSLDMKLSSPPQPTAMRKWTCRHPFEPAMRRRMLTSIYSHHNAIADAFEMIARTESVGVRVHRRVDDMFHMRSRQT